MPNGPLNQPNDRSEHLVSVAVSPTRLREMAQDILHLASLVESLEKRELPYQMQGGLSLETRRTALLDGTVFSIGGQLQVIIPKTSQEISA